MPKYKKVKLKLVSLITDRNQYKPYMATLSGENIFVEVDVPEDYVVSATSKETIITTDGLSAVLDAVASSIDEMHEAHRKSKYGN